MLHDRLLSALSAAPGGLTIAALAERIGLEATPSSLAVMEATLLYSSEISREGNRWKLMVKGRAAQLLSAIENYADTSGKKIFRLAAALSSLPASAHPTEEELRQVLDASSGRFVLLPNAMIKRN
jgi:hypothetical protein